MDRIYEEELRGNLKECVEKRCLEGKRVYLFGHCEATLILADRLFEYGIKPAAILDNNEIKYGILYKDIPVRKPDWILNEKPQETIVLIVTRFFESMKAQLQAIGYAGEIKKLVDYNTYAEYSLSTEAVLRKRERLMHGKEMIAALREKYPGHLLVFCPFRALGDVYFAMSYLPHFLKRRGRGECAVCVIGQGCGEVVLLFGDYPVEIFSQKELDAAVQGCLYEERDDTFVAHQDRPYVVDLNRALYLKKIPLEKIYCCGVFDLPYDTQPAQPEGWKEYSEKGKLEKGKAVILSPYAKSVTAIPNSVWEQIIADYRGKGYQIYTNVTGDEKPLSGTLPICPGLSEMKSAVEQAGTFIGIRSGLCDVIRTANCRKIALYPDYPYCDTKWKSIDMYSIEGFENIVVKDGFEWKKH